MEQDIVLTGRRASYVTGTHFIHAERVNAKGCSWP